MAELPDDDCFEPFVHLIDVSDTSALVGWGGFYFGGSGDRQQVVDDDDLTAPGRRDGGTIGACSPPYGHAVVEALDADGNVVARAETDDANHVWLDGLAPDTEYRYRIEVDGRRWAEGPRRAWAPEDGGMGTLVESDREYDLRFRTHPGPDDPTSVTFLAFGDYGVGIDDDEYGENQLGIARTMEALARRHPVRFLVSLGDNIYHQGDDDTADSGDEDDDWYLTFYEPYRFLLDHLPVYPAAGNHDGKDTEANDDRDQLEDNFHLQDRFAAKVEDGRASLDPGLFYAVRVSGLLELVCVDTSWGQEEGIHYFDDPEHQKWLQEVLPEGGGSGDGPVWRVPFCHHPPYCAGPHHENMQEQIDALVPLYQRASVRLVLCGHEHNFQHGRREGIDIVIAGGAGKLQEDPPCRWDDGGTLAWAAEPHCLLIEVTEDEIAVTPYGPIGANGTPEPIAVRDRDGRDVPSRFFMASS